MSRGDGFDRMDVSTSIDDDPKFRTLARRHPELLASAGWAYVGLLARSWREGTRLTLEEGWPAFLPFDEATVDVLRDVGLVDAETRIPTHAWDDWYGTAAERRRAGRERQRRADEKRGRIRPSGPTGQTDSPSVSQAGPSSDQRGSNVGPNGLTTIRGYDAATCPACGDGPLDDADPNVATDRRGQLWHRSCPTTSLEASA